MGAQNTSCVSAEENRAGEPLQWLHDAIMKDYERTAAARLVGVAVGQNPLA
jgi:hypothetical protein